MPEHRSSYRKNFYLIVALLVVISISLVAALAINYSLTEKHVEGEFASQKISVLEESVKPYSEFFQNKIPEVSFYQGYLDSGTVVKYIDTLFRKYLFVDKVIFYDTQVSNHLIINAINANHLAIDPKVVYQFIRGTGQAGKRLYSSSEKRPLPFKTAEEFNRIVAKFTDFVQSADTTRAISPDDQFKIFYSISPNRITYMSNPRKEELRIFQDLMMKHLPRSPVYKQDILTFFLNPASLKIHNIHPELYEHISIKPLVYEQLDSEPGLFITDIQLPGAFSGYKLYFTSSKALLNREISRRFFPIAAGFILIYAILLFLAWLIYRNLNINSQLFKLQYDFINNLTHEFKTPVSVIKIAGNNIRSSTSLSDRERAHYGKILDEEADKLNDLMNKLLSFTQIENNAIKVKEETINIDIFIQNIIDQFQLKYPDFVIDYQVEEVEYFLSDPLLLGSIFQNLIDNAYKYSPPDRRELDIFVQLGLQEIIFIFSDKGIGIPATELKNIFEKFYRVQSQYNQQGSAGLGLAFCKELANFMGGQLKVESEENKGSKFTLSLPYRN